MARWTRGRDAEPEGDSESPAIREDMKQESDQENGDKQSGAD